MRDIEFERKKAEIRQYAKEVAARLQGRPTDSIQIPKQTQIQYEETYEEVVEERKLFRTIKKTVQGTRLRECPKVVYQKQKIDGWIIKIFTEDAVENGQACKEIRTYKSIYALKTDGTLIFYELHYKRVVGFGIGSAPNDERVYNVSFSGEKEMSFEKLFRKPDGSYLLNDLPWIGSAFIFDFNYENISYKIKHTDDTSIFRNYPFSAGGNLPTTKGGTWKEYSDGEGIRRALKTLESKIMQRPQKNLEKRRPHD